MGRFKFNKLNHSFENIYCLNFRSLSRFASSIWHPFCHSERSEESPSNNKISQSFHSLPVRQAGFEMTSFLSFRTQWGISFKSQFLVRRSLSRYTPSRWQKVVLMSLDSCIFLRKNRNDNSFAFKLFNFVFKLYLPLQSF